MHELKLSVRDTPKQLTTGELDLLLEAQRAVIQVGGCLGLFDDLSFVIASDQAGLIGLLACRPDGESVWLQIAYVRPHYRRSGVFSAMFEKCLSMVPGKEIGLGTQRTNQPMLAAAEKFGFRERAVYLYRK